MTRTGPEPGVLRALVDVRFRHTVTPRLIGYLYALAVGTVAAGSVFGLLLVWALASWLGGGWWWFAPLVLACGLLALLAIRVICEWALVPFRTADAARSTRPVPPGPPVGPPVPTPGPLPPAAPSGPSRPVQPAQRRDWGSGQGRTQR